MRIARLLLAMSIAAFPAAFDALAQMPPPVAPLPSELVPRSGDTRLPGPDPRQCGSSRFEAICAQGRWVQFSKMDVHVKVAGFTGDYEIELAENRETHVTYRETLNNVRRGGEAMLIGAEGIAYRTRDKLPDPDEIIDYMMSSPIMMARLAASLLDLGVLGPPSDVTKRQEISADDASRYLRAEAPRLATLYGPPWRMTGTVRRTDDNRIAFALRLRYHPVDTQGRAIANKTESLGISGTVSYAPARASFPDTMDLAGWTLLKGSTSFGKPASLSEARSALGP